MPRGTSTSLQYGPGILRIAPLGTAEPVDLTTAWDAAWVALGYTEDGSTFTAQIQTAAVEVAEELEVIKYVTTGRNATVTFNASEVLAKNLKIAMNGGTITTGTGIVTYDPPPLGSEVRVMCGWESETADERWIYRQCLNSGSVAIDRKKGENNAAIPITFNLEKPNSVQSWRAIMASARA